MDLPARGADISRFHSLFLQTEDSSASQPKALSANCMLGEQPTEGKSGPEAPEVSPSYPTPAGRASKNACVTCHC